MPKKLYKHGPIFGKLTFEKKRFGLLIVYFICDGQVVACPVETLINNLIVIRVEM